MTTRHQFYRINGVDRSGSSWAECTLMDPRAVVDRLKVLRAARKDRDYWVDDPDDEERGDIEMEVEEAIFEWANRDVPTDELLRRVWAGKDGSRGDGGPGPEGISGYGLSNPVQITDREREPSFSLRSIPYRVMWWRWKNRVRTLPWGWLGGALLMVWSAALTTWLVLEVAAWVLR